MDVLKEWWGMVAGLFTFIGGLIVWAVRLENMGHGNAAEIRRLWRQREEDLHAQREAREATNRLIAEKHQEQSEQLRELRADIKALLHRAS
ncbi:hypothetical protein ORIO_02235 [Cereibacter azotoformans]|nr:hypothetical protein [Cereibacter azotoformans]ULB08755.1 hypothetical protein ORIO_02235 [Cereibacter azotoformans]